MLKKLLIISMIFIIILLNLCTTVSYAKVAVTDENLTEALQNFAKSSSNEKNYKISVANKVITISVDGKNYELKYDLSGNPTFTYEVDIKKGMSYEELKSKTDDMTFPMIGYIATANIQGIEYNAAGTYVAMCLLQSAFSQASEASNSQDQSEQYIIVNDGVTYEGDGKVIKESEFGDHVIEYVNAMYGKQTIYKDTEGINSFEWIGEKQDISSTECKLISKIVINLDADFSKLKESENFADESFLDKSINEENADYVIKLKVGQKCKIESDEEITGYAVSGSGSVEFNDDKNEITAKGEGKVNGYLYVGDNNSTKSIYVVIEENPGNQTVEPISIKIEGKANADPTPVTTPTPSTTPTITPTPTATPVPSTSPTPVATPVKTSVPTSTPKVTTTNSTAGIVLPKAGNSSAFAIVGICICIVSAIIYAIKIKNLKNIK